VKTIFQTKLTNLTEQILEKSITLEVDGEGVMKVFRDTILNRHIYPQEFLLFIAKKAILNSSDGGIIGIASNIRVKRIKVALSQL